MSRERLRTAGLAAGLTVLVLVPLAIWGISALSEDGDEDLSVGTLPAPPGGNPEIVVMLPSEDLNVPEAVDGASSVAIVCVRASGEVEFRVDHLFPFTDTDGGSELPHVHQAVSPDQLEAIESCRLEGGALELEGQVESESIVEPSDGGPVETPEL